MGMAVSLLAGSLSDQRGGLDRGDVSASELGQASLDRMTDRASLGAIVSRRDDAALMEAESASQRIALGKSLSAIDGLPVLLKDNIVQAGEPLSCSSRIR